LEKNYFWVQFLGSIILIITVLLILGHFYIEIKVYGVARTWEIFKMQCKARIDGSQRKERIEREKRKDIYKQEEAVRQKIEDKKRAVQRKIEEEEKKAHQQMIEDAGGWEKYSELLKNEYEKEKAELSIQKKIKCDDGSIRIYKEDMRGVISESGYYASFFIYKALTKAHINLVNLVIDREKWFSKEGKTLNRDEIISNNNYKRQLNEKFQKKYKEIIEEKQRQNRFRGQMTEINYHYHQKHLICINGIFFYSNITPFSGELKFKKNSEDIIIKDGYITDSISEKKTLNEIKLDFFTVKNIDSAVLYKFNECFVRKLDYSKSPFGFDSYYDKIKNFYNYYDKIQDSLE